jgi:hypothetical protein
LPTLFQQARAFYGSALPVQPGDQQPYWTSGQQTLPPNPTGSNLFSVAATLGGLGALGMARLPSGRRVFDYYMSGIRAFEEFSPGFVFRTFQLSHLLSPWETAARQTRYLPPEMLRAMGTGPSLQWRRHVERLAGKTLLEAGAYEKGLLFKGGRLYVGEDTFLRHASVVRSPGMARGAYQAAYARSLAGGPLAIEAALEQRVPFHPSIGSYFSKAEAQAERFFFTGGQTRISALGRKLTGYGTLLAERINQLAKAPFELPVLSNIFSPLAKYIPGVSKEFGFGVRPTSGLKTFGKITAKLGVGSLAAYLGYQQLDYLVRGAAIFDDTAFSEGLTAGLATLWTRGQMAASRGADLLSLHDYREAQEAVAPGSTSLGTLAAFPIIGALGGLGVGYAQRLARQAKYTSQLGSAQAAIAAVGPEYGFRSIIYKEELPKDLLSAANRRTRDLVRQQAKVMSNSWQGKLAAYSIGKQKSGSVLWKALGKITPTSIKWKAGLLLGTAAIAPFIPGALIPGARPEELEQLYAGEQEVAIRKGRWWEFGRSPYEGQRIMRFQKHWYPRMLARAKERSIWGDEPPSPMEQWYRANFTYDIEQAHYYDRPYPITGSAFQDIPFIGPLLSATIGRWFKPPMLMHEEEWRRSGPAGDQVLAMPLKYGQQASVEALGEVGPGEPISSAGVKGVVGRQAYNLQEMIGLPGFTMASIKEAITGSPELFDKEMQLEEAGRIYSPARGWWDLEMGGILGCFRKGTSISTNRGPYPIEKIKEGDYVLSSNGQYKKVKRVIKKRSSNFTTLKARGFGKVLTSTSGHHIPIIRRHCYKGGHPKPFNKKNIDIFELKASEIQKRDLLFIPISQAEKPLRIDLKDTGRSYTDNWVYSHCSQEWANCREYLEEMGDQGHQTRQSLRKVGYSDSIAKEVLYEFRRGAVPYRVPRFIEVDRQFAYAVGWYIAEGCSDGTRLSFTMNSNEAEYANEIFSYFW